MLKILPFLYRLNFTPLRVLTSRLICYFTVCPKGSETAKPGRYGPDCKEDCKCDYYNSNQSYTCDPQSGQCFCKAGWKGQRCTERKQDLGFFLYLNR